jgi:hypothetical protein
MKLHLKRIFLLFIIVASAWLIGGYFFALVSKPFISIPKSPRSQCPKHQVVEFLQLSDAVALSQDEKLRLFKAFKYFTILLDYHNIIYYISYGALLAHLRGAQSMLPFDDDVDISVFKADRKRIKEIFTLKKWPPNMREFYENISYTDFTNGKVYYQQSGCAQPLLPKWKFCFPYVDLLFMLENDTHTWLDAPCSERFHKKDVFPLKRVNFYNFTVWAPQHGDRLMEAILLRRDFRTICCSNKYSHKREKYTSNFVCLPCECLNNTRYDLWP